MSNYQPLAFGLGLGLGISVAASYSTFSDVLLDPRRTRIAVRHIRERIGDLLKSVAQVIAYRLSCNRRSIFLSEESPPSSHADVCSTACSCTGTAPGG